MLSVRDTISQQFGLTPVIPCREMVFERWGQHHGILAFRAQLTDLAHKPGNSLPPKTIPPHPRLAPIPAIHFDHYNSSVTNLDAPDQNDRLEITLKDHRRGIVPLGTCINFMLDDEDNIYGFSGNLMGLGGRTEFKLALFDKDFNKLDEYSVTQFSSLAALFNNLPINLGYFAMDDQGRVIVIKEKTAVEFIKKDSSNKLRRVKRFDLKDQLRDRFSRRAADNGLAQIMPTHTTGYWGMALGKGGVRDASAFLMTISEDGKIIDHHEFKEEVIENGMAVDATGAYVVTDQKMYKFSLQTSGRINLRWEKAYERSSKKKKGVISDYGSGSTPTLFGRQDNYVAITDNADERVNLLVYRRNDGELIAKIPLFKKGKSANENSVLAYRNSVIVQNWYAAPGFTKDMKGLEPGLMRFDIDESHPDNYRQIWYNEHFASTATVRLSTKTGMIYGTIRMDSREERYAMVFIDFETGHQVRQEYLGSGKPYRIAMSPSYLLPGRTLLQPVRTGVVVIRPA